MGKTRKMVKAVRRRIRRGQKKLFDPRAHILKLVQKGMVCAEIGVWKGTFSQKILRRHPIKLHLIDPWLYLPEFGNRSYGQRGDNDQARMDRIYEDVQRRFHHDQSVEIHRMTSEQAGPLFAGNYFDFIYIDGNHNYEFVKRDIELYLPKVKRGGLITGDDYIFRRCPQGGPKRAVAEIMESTSLELLSVKNNQYVLRRL